MDFSEVLQQRVSIRNFKETSVSKSLLTTIVSEAQQAPSWANSQPWQVYIATGDTMQQIRKSHVAKTQQGLKGDAELAVKDIQQWGSFPWANMKTWLDKVGSDTTMTDFGAASAALWQAPAMAYITVPKTTPVWSIYDTGAFAQTMMLAAASHGVDTMVAYENVKYPAEIRAHLPISATERIVAGIALGYRSDDKINHFTNNRIATEQMLTIK